MYIDAKEDREKYAPNADISKIVVDIFAGTANLFLSRH